MQKLFQTFGLLMIILSISQCDQPSNNPQQTKETNKSDSKEVTTPPKNIGYHFEKGKAWIKLHKTDSLQKNIVLAINRIDEKHLALLDSILVPNDSSLDMKYYMPFPLQVSGIKDIKKILFFSYPAQVFAAYQMGELVYTGPTNMGRKNDQTPTGLFFTNWKAEKTTSTFNDEWDLKWNFNIENKLGVGFHQYDLPGYPASHSCLRLLEKDAMYLYNWADQWVMDEKNKDSVAIKGTPVIVFGSYPFGSPKPWLQLISDAHKLDMSEADIQKLTEPFLQEILAAQQKRSEVKL